MRAALAALVIFTVLTSGPAGATSPKAGPLVDAAWLSQHHSDPGIAVLDVRDDRREYVAGHVPGALFTEYDKDWRITRKGIPRMLPPFEKLEHVIGKAGIGNDDHVIIVAAGIDDEDMAVATRVYWTFRMLGHDMTSILDGGMKAYTDRKFETERKPARRTQKVFKANIKHSPIADTAFVERALDGSYVLIDTRRQANYKGLFRSADVLRAGTIPGAKNVSSRQVLAPKSAKFENKETIEKLMTSAGVDLSKPVIAFSDTGHKAALVWFAVSEILGRRDAKLYDGSLAAWARDPHNPMVVPK